jgi:hypothetical protein
MPGSEDRYRYENLCENQSAEMRPNATSSCTNIQADTQSDLFEGMGANSLVLSERHVHLRQGGVVAGTVSFLYFAVLALHLLSHPSATGPGRRYRRTDTR